jgi:SagB-type dehydrogenase family enzyme
VNKRLVASDRKKKRRAGWATLSARLIEHVTIDSRADATISASFDHHAVGLGRFSAGARERAHGLRVGLPLTSFAAERTETEREINRLVRRLAAHGLLEWCLSGTSDREADVIIEPQLPDYWPRAAPLHAADVVALSRFAYLRRRGSDLVLESPRAGALFRVCNPKLANALALLAMPQPLRNLRRQHGSAGAELLGLLLDCQIVFRIKPDEKDALRAAEGDKHLVLWDFHDLLFHARSMEGRHASPHGGLYVHAGAIPPLPALRPRWPGKKIDLSKFAAAQSQPISALAKLLSERHSTRVFSDKRPITIAELARVLDVTSRVQTKWSSKDTGTPVEYAARPYPSGGASYPLELYLAANSCEGLARGFYHYDAGAHALVPISVSTPQLEALVRGAQFAMGAPAPPQVLITIAARFGRVAWKYSALAYALVLKDAGVLMQTLYLAATEMGLGGCAIGTANIDLFAKMTGIEFHIEGPVGQFALGRAGNSEK